MEEEEIKRRLRNLEKDSWLQLIFLLALLSNILVIYFIILR